MGCGRALAFAAVLTFALAPLLHGIVHPDHQIEALLKRHAPGFQDFGDRDKAGHHCDLYLLCIASGDSATPAPDLAPPAPADLAAGQALPWLAPFLNPRDPPRGRGPPALLA